MRELLVRSRRLWIIALHLALWTISFSAVFALRFEFEIPATYVALGKRWIITLLVIRTATFLPLHLFQGLWRYSGLRDLLGILKGTAVSSFVFSIVAVFYASPPIPKSILVLEPIFALLFVGGARMATRTIREIAVRNAAANAAHRRILVVGAGNAADSLVRDILRAHARFDLVGLLDDQPGKQNESLHGVRVLGKIASLPEIVATKDVHEVIIAIPSLKGADMRRIVDLCSASNVTVRTLPGVDALVDGRVTLEKVQSVNIEDLLRREPVALDAAVISGYLEGKRVLVTGAGGSIGSELCRQIARFKPAELTLVEQAENSLFEVHRRLGETFPALRMTPLVADICDTKRIEAVLRAVTPEVVFHAAAHKHVPMMECNPGEAVKNNVFGTKKLADLAHAAGVHKFVMVSTDKAVNPTSVMGATKRLAEIYLQALSTRSQTQFVTVRFGNVLGSSGSVVPIFREQIARGGPVTVTHPDVKRYFMTIAEACQLVMQAGAMGSGGELLVLDMGEPVRIVDLAMDLIRLSGYAPTDIEITFTGLRPGEKLFEELALREEQVEKTKHPQIYIGNQAPLDPAKVDAAFVDLTKATTLADNADARAHVWRALTSLGEEVSRASDRPPPLSSKPTIDAFA